MKDWIQRQYGHLDTISLYNRLCAIIIKAWEAIPNERVRELIESMPIQCQPLMSMEAILCIDF
jgi:hypothetical protein